MFKWIRTRVRDAFLAGMQDGIDALGAAPADGKLDLSEPRLLRLPPPDDDDDEDDEDEDDEEQKTVTAPKTRRTRKQA